MAVPVAPDVGSLGESARLRTVTSGFTIECRQGRLGTERASEGGTQQRRGNVSKWDTPAALWSDRVA